jgi:hypothetical protein
MPFATYGETPLISAKGMVIRTPSRDVINQWSFK